MPRIRSSEINAGIGLILFAYLNILFASCSALRMSHPLAGPCQQGKQNPRESSMRFLRCRKTRENLNTLLRFSTVSVSYLSMRRYPSDAPCAH
uniref:Uncharacterized protein n=1 Tax=Candidatus Kentrum sp. TUN TaxID=2126343 RepID=A0A451AM45_9GAMM|nr:MAG: hypothetical protein BECKTUN1418F_GA0071002_11348 [Candidatus Kentron sp. TUN]VFK67085.1 MAG: hypothetical protein BECKTUN1418E_GA0071001_11318 [Candidatus Kentron sp. TUN]